MPDLTKYADYALNPEFRRLSPLARRLVLEESDPDFAALSEGARDQIAARYDSEAVRGLGAQATREGAAQALGFELHTPLPKRMAQGVADWVTSDRPSTVREPTLIETDERGQPVLRERGPSPVAGLADIAEDIARGPSAVLERLGAGLDWAAHRLQAGGESGFAGATHMLANAFDLMPDRPIVSEREFDEGVAPTLRRAGQSDEEIARRRAWATQPTRLGALADTAEAAMRDASQGFGMMAEAHRAASPAVGFDKELAAATLEAGPAAAVAIGEIAPAVMVAGRLVPRAAANITGMAAHGAVARADEGLEGAVAGAAHGAVLGGGLDAIHAAGVTPALQRLMGAGLFGGDAAIAGANAAEIIAAGLTGAGLVNPREAPMTREARAARRAAIRANPNVRFAQTRPYRPELPTDRANLFAQEYPQAVNLARRIQGTVGELATPAPQLAPGRPGPVARELARRRADAERQPTREGVIEQPAGEVSAEALRQSWLNAAEKAEALETELSRTQDPTERAIVEAEYRAAEEAEIAAQGAYDAAVREGERAASRTAADAGPVGEYIQGLREAWGAEGFEKPPSRFPDDMPLEILERVEIREGELWDAALRRGATEEQLNEASERLYAEDAPAPPAERPELPKPKLVREGLSKEEFGRVAAEDRADAEARLGRPLTAEEAKKRESALRRERAFNRDTFIELEMERGDVSREVAERMADMEAEAHALGWKNAGLDVWPEEARIRELRAQIEALRDGPPEWSNDPTRWPSESAIPREYVEPLWRLHFRDEQPQVAEPALRAWEREGWIERGEDGRWRSTDELGEELAPWNDAAERVPRDLEDVGGPTAERALGPQDVDTTGRMPEPAAQQAELAADQRMRDRKRAEAEPDPTEEVEIALFHRPERSGMNIQAWEKFWDDPANRGKVKSFTANVTRADLADLPTLLAKLDELGLPRGSGRGGIYEIQTPDGIWSMPTTRSLRSNPKKAEFKTWEQMEAEERAETAAAEPARREVVADYTRQLEPVEAAAKAGDFMALNEAADAARRSGVPVAEVAQAAIRGGYPDNTRALGKLLGMKADQTREVQAELKALARPQVPDSPELRALAEEWGIPTSDFRYEVSENYVNVYVGGRDIGGKSLWPEGKGKGKPKADPETRVRDLLDDPLSYRPGESPAELNERIPPDRPEFVHDGGHQRVAGRGVGFELDLINGSAPERGYKLILSANDGRRVVIEVGPRVETPAGESPRFRDAEGNIHPLWHHQALALKQIRDAEPFPEWRPLDEAAAQNPLEGDVWSTVATNTMDDLGGAKWRVGPTGDLMGFELHGQKKNFGGTFFNANNLRHDGGQFLRAAKGAPPPEQRTGAEPTPTAKPKKKAPRKKSARTKAPPREAPAREGDEISQAVTGQPIEARLFRGEGREDWGEVYGPGADGPIFGEARYSSPDRGYAEVFGPSVIEVRARLEKPYVLDSNKALEKLLADFTGSPVIPLENAARARVFRSARRKLEEKGFDGVVVRLPELADVNPEGQSVKRLREIFDVSQVIEFAPEPEATPARVDTRAEARRRHRAEHPVLSEQETFEWQIQRHEKAADRAKEIMDSTGNAGLRAKAEENYRRHTVQLNVLRTVAAARDAGTLPPELADLSGRAVADIAYLTQPGGLATGHVERTIELTSEQVRAAAQAIVELAQPRGEIEAPRVYAREYEVWKKAGATNEQAELGADLVMERSEIARTLSELPPPGSPNATEWQQNHRADLTRRDTDLGNQIARLLSEIEGAKKAETPNEQADREAREARAEAPTTQAARQQFAPSDPKVGERLRNNGIKAAKSGSTAARRQVGWAMERLGELWHSGAVPVQLETVKSEPIIKDLLRFDDVPVGDATRVKRAQRHNLGTTKRWRDAKNLLEQLAAEKEREYDTKRTEAEEAEVVAKRQADAEQAEVAKRELEDRATASKVPATELAPIGKLFDAYTKSKHPRPKAENFEREDLPSIEVGLKLIDMGEIPHRDVMQSIAKDTHLAQMLLNQKDVKHVHAALKKAMRDTPDIVLAQAPDPVPKSPKRTLPTTDAEAVKAVGEAASRDETRYNLNFVGIDEGGRIFATDGHRLHILEATNLRPREYTRATLGPKGKIDLWYRGQDKKWRPRDTEVDSSEVEYPNIEQVIPKTDRGYHIVELGPADAARYHDVLTATMRRYGLTHAALGSPAGKGVEAENAKHGRGQHREIELPGGVAVNIGYLRDALDFVRPHVTDRNPLTMHVPADGLSPIQLRAGFATAVVMPMRRGAGDPWYVMPGWDWNQYTWRKRAKVKGAAEGDTDAIAAIRQEGRDAERDAVVEQMVGELHEILDPSNEVGLRGALARLELQAEAAGPFGEGQLNLPWGHTLFSPTQPAPMTGRAAGEPLGRGERDRAVQMLEELRELVAPRPAGRTREGLDFMEEAAPIERSIIDFPEGETPPGGGRGAINRILSGYTRELGGKPTPSTQPTRPAEKPLGREPILARFQRDLGVQVLVGPNEKTRRGAAGYRHRITGLIRVKRRSDLEVTAHEIGHHVDASYPAIAEWYKQHAGLAQREMREASYDVDKPREWFAEFHRYWLTQRDKLAEFAPEAVKWWETEFLPQHPKLEAALYRAQRDMHAWFDQSPLDQARSQIGRNPLPIRERVDSWWKSKRETISDDIHWIRQLEIDAYGRLGRVAEGLRSFEWELKNEDGTTERGTAYQREDVPAGARILETNQRPGAGAYRLARLTRAAHAITEGAIRFGAPKWKVVGGEIEYSGKALMDILGQVRTQEVVDLDGTPWGQGDHARRSRRFGPQFRLGADHLDAYMLYAVGKRAQLMRKQKRENLFSDQQIADMVRLGEVNPHFKDVLAEYQEWNKAFLDFAEAAGVIDAEKRKEWETDVYLPFYRENRVSTHLVGHGLPPGKIQVIKRLTGGTSNLRPVIDNMIANSTMLMDAALTNLARREVLTLAEQPGMGAKYGVERRAEGSEQVGAYTWAVRNAIYKELGWPRTELEKAFASGRATPEEIRQWDELSEAFDRQGLLMQLVKPAAPVGESPIVAYLENGKPRYFEIADEGLYRSFLSLNRAPADALVNALSIGARVKRRTVTLSPNFWIRNMIRDPVSAWVYSQHGFNPLTDAFRGWRDTLLARPEYEDFLANGGGFSGLVRDEASFRRQSKNLARWYRERGIDPAGVVRDFGRDPVGGFMRGRDFLEKIADSAEMASRVGEMRRARGEGELGFDAAYSAKEVASDYSMRPQRITAWGRRINAMYDMSWPMRAGVVSLDRAIRAVTEKGPPPLDPKHGEARERVVKGMMTVAAAGVALEAINSGDLLGLDRNGLIPVHDRYDNLDDVDRDAHWHWYIPTPAYWGWLAGMNEKPEPGENSAYWHLRQARPWEVGALSRIAEIGMEPFIRSVAGTETTLNDQTAGEVAAHMAHLAANQFRLDPIPDLGEPALEVAVNRDFYTGGPVEPLGVRDLEKWRKANSRTSATAIAAGEATRDLPSWAQINPIVADHLIRGYWTWYGTFALDTADRLTTEAPAWNLRQVPAVGAVMRGQQVSRSKAEAELGDILAEANETYSTFRSFADQIRPRRDLAEEYADDPERALGIMVSRSGIGDELQSFRSAAADVRASDDLAAVQAVAEDLEATRESIQGQPTFRVSALKKGGQWSNLPALKRAVINELDRRRAVVAYRRRQEIQRAEREVGEPR